IQIQEIHNSMFKIYSFLLDGVEPLLLLSGHFFCCLFLFKLEIFSKRKSHAYHRLNQYFPSDKITITSVLKKHVVS
ncbi:hypothetical protein VIGAN_06185500, partial [Vigna angularis var. angularis]